MEGNGNMRDHQQLYPLGLANHVERIYLDETYNQNVAFHTGKWTNEEEAYIQGLIEEFQDGHLDIADGTSLRQFLAKMLHCRPKRISKKFEGNNYSNGTKFYKKSPNQLNMEELLQRRAKLSQMEQRFNDSIKARQMPHELRQAAATSANATAAGVLAGALGNRVSSPYAAAASAPHNLERASSLDQPSGLLYHSFLQQQQLQGQAAEAVPRSSASMNPSVADRNLLHALAGTDRRTALIRALMMQNSAQQQQQHQQPSSFQNLLSAPSVFSDNTGTTQASPSLGALGPNGMSFLLQNQAPLNSIPRRNDWMASQGQQPSAGLSPGMLLAALQQQQHQQQKQTVAFGAGNQLEQLMQATAPTDMLTTAGLLGSPNARASQQQQSVMQSLLDNAMNQRRRLEGGTGGPVEKKFRSG